MNSPFRRSTLSLARPPWAVANEMSEPEGPWVEAHPPADDRHDRNGLSRHASRNTSLSPAWEPSSVPRTSPSAIERYRIWASVATSASTGMR